MEPGQINWQATIITGVVSGLIVNLLGWSILNLWARMNARSRRKRVKELEEESTRIERFAKHQATLYTYGLGIIIMLLSLLSLAVGLTNLFDLVRGFSVGTFIYTSLCLAAFLIGWDALKTFRRVKAVERFRARTDRELKRLQSHDRS